MARRRIGVAIERHYPGYLRIALTPNQIEMTIDAVARKLTAG